MSTTKPPHENRIIEMLRQARERQQTPTPPVNVYRRGAEAIKTQRSRK